MTYLYNVDIGKNNGRRLYIDMVYSAQVYSMPTVIFCHGFKGFKDWGPWKLVAEKFAKAGYLWIAINFSHNGVGKNKHSEFDNLEAFAENDYSKELLDLEKLHDVLIKKRDEGLLAQIDINCINLIGHSRGGGVVLTYAAENPAIKCVATWASIATFDRFGSPEEIEKWRKDGVKYVHNGRTGQDMPMNFSFYEDFAANKERLNIEARVQEMEQDLLVVHGTDDSAVGFSHAKRLCKWNPNAELFPVEGAGHTFGGKHPYTKKKKLPKHLKKVVKKTIKFFKKNNKHVPVYM